MQKSFTFEKSKKSIASLFGSNGNKAYKAYKLKMFVALLTLLALVSLALSFGAVEIKVFDVFRIVLSKMPLLNKFNNIDDLSTSVSQIVLNIRIPRIIVAVLCGSCLSVAGAAYQGMFKNDMADPFVLGISSGASAAAAIAVSFGISWSVFGFSAVAVCAFGGAIISTLLVYNIARVGNRVPPATLLLSGVSINFIMSAIITLVMVLKRSMAEKIIFWTMGSFSAAGWKDVFVIAPFVLVGILIVFFFSKDLDAMMSSDETARTLGVEVETLKKILLVTTSLMVAVVVSSCGVIGFVGLMIPHISRMIVGPAHKKMIPFAAVLGGIFMVLADTVSRTIVPPAEIPVGAITAICGAPFFLFLLRKSKRR